MAGLDVRHLEGTSDTAATWLVLSWLGARISTG